MAKKKANGEAKKRGPAKKPAPAPDSYSSDRYQRFLQRIDNNSSDLAEIQADRRELVKAEADQGLNKKAHAFVQSLRTAVRNDKMTVQDALATLECVDTYADWSGLRDQLDMYRGKKPKAAGEDKPAIESAVAAKEKKGDALFKSS